MSKTARTPHRTKKTKAKGRASSANSKKQCIGLNKLVTTLRRTANHW